jgi:ribonuclease VapC
MIAVDTSALMPIALGETGADACLQKGSRNRDRGRDFRWNRGRSQIAAARRNVGEEMSRMIDGLGFEIVSVTPASARRIAAAHALWGRGAHPAGLNFGDCFSYEVAKERSCPLLYVGDDSRKPISKVLCRHDFRRQAATRWEENNVKVRCGHPA